MPLVRGTIVTVLRPKARIAICSPLENEAGEPLGYIAEEPRGFLSMFARQIFRTHRPFRALVMDLHGSPILWVRSIVVFPTSINSSNHTDSPAVCVDKFAHVCPTFERPSPIYPRRRTCSRHIRRSPTGVASLAKTLSSLPLVIQIPLHIISSKTSITVTSPGAFFLLLPAHSRNPLRIHSPNLQRSTRGFGPGTSTCSMRVARQLQPSTGRSAALGERSALHSQSPHLMLSKGAKRYFPCRFSLIQV
jgi:hypothetical protein